MYVWYNDNRLPRNTSQSYSALYSYELWVSDDSDAVPQPASKALHRSIVHLLWSQYILSPRPEH